MGQNVLNGDNMTLDYEPIAIVGVGCRLPGDTTSLENLWDFMRKLKAAHTVVPSRRWNSSAWHHPNQDRKGAVAPDSAFFLNQDVASFDAPFFSTTPAEAAGMDPQKRMLLEVTYESLENAGMSLEKVAGSLTGVYVGCMTNDYEILSTDDIYDQPHMAAAGSSEAMTANRVSWFFDFRGPSFTLDSACSSSLIALHLACQSLRLRETDMNVVAGVNLMLHPRTSSQLTAMHMLSPDGTSHSFDDRANGYGRGEGIGAIIVKRLSDAVRDGDTIRAVIRGSATNVDGKTPSVTMPSTEAQAELIRTAYKVAGLPLEDTAYVELHGTGTPLGDPIELAAIASTFGACGQLDKAPVYVGSIKPNVGHTEGCAGLAGVLKAIVSLEKGTILPTAGVETVNPKLKFDAWKLALAPDVIPWPTDGPRRVSINSFGFGGANAHVIMDDAYHYMKQHGIKGFHSTEVPLTLPNGICIAKAPPKPKQGDQKLFVFSARDQPVLKKVATAFQSYTNSAEQGRSAEQKEKLLANIAYSLAHKRSLFDYRSSEVASSLDQLAKQLEKGLPRTLRRLTKSEGVAFVFTGQGAQWAGMGKELLSNPVFAKSIDASRKCLVSLGCPFDLLEELQRKVDSKVDSPEYSQPLCTSVQIALVDLLRFWGVQPKAVVGHSSGEIAGAYGAGIITHEDAMKVSYFRGVYSLKVAKGPRRGAMLAAGISEEDAFRLLKARGYKGVVTTACINSPKSVTLSGDVDEITALEGEISNSGKFARKLRVSTAYHSAHMQDVAEECLAAMTAAGVADPRETDVPMFSSLTGDLISYTEVDKTYWVRNMTQPVRFSQAVHQLLTRAPGPSRSRAHATTPRKWNSLVEIGPHSALKAPLVQIMENVSKKLATELEYTSMLARGEDAITTALKCAGTLWALGNPLSMARVNSEEETTGLQLLTDLPSYPWNHDRQYWHEPKTMKSERLKTVARSDLLGFPIDNQNPYEPQWKNYLRISENPWIEDHAITGTTLYPGAGMLVMAIEAAQQIADPEQLIRGIEFRDVHFERGLVVPSDGAIETLLSIKRPTSSNDCCQFTVFSNLGNGPWSKHCHGVFSIKYEEKVHGHADADDPEIFEWKRRTELYEFIKKLPGKEADVEKLYEDLEAIGMEYGETFQNLTSLTIAENGAGCHGTVKVPDTLSVMPDKYEYPHRIHPATLDSIFHLMVATISDGSTMKEAAVPFHLERMYVANELPHGAGSLFHGYANLDFKEGDLLSASMVVSDETWREPKVIVESLIMKQVTGGAADALSQHSTTDLEPRCTKPVWNFDPSVFVGSKKTSNGQSTATMLQGVTNLRDWLEIEYHKSPLKSVLLIGSSTRRDIVQELGAPSPLSGTYQGVHQLVVSDTSEIELELWRTAVTSAGLLMDTIFKVWNLDDADSAPLADHSFDLIITGGYWPNSRVQSLLDKSLQPEGRLLVLEPVRNDATENRVEVNGGYHHKFDKRRIKLEDGILNVAAKARHDAPGIDKVALLLPSGTLDCEAENLAGNLEAVLKLRNIPVKKVKLLDEKVLSGHRHFISLLDLQHGFADRWTASEFDQFKQLIHQAEHIFWLGKGGQMIKSSEDGLSKASTTGLFRVLRNESPQVALIQLDLSSQCDVASSATAELVAHTWATSVAKDAEQTEREFVEHQGEVLIPRFVQLQAFDKEIAIATGTAPATLAKMGSKGPLRLELKQKTLEGSVWEPDVGISSMTVGPSEVEVKVSHISTSNAGSEARVVSTLGTQVTGVVTRVGSEVSGITQGDQIFLLRNSPGCSTLVRQDASTVRKVPSGIPPAAAATVAWLYLAAAYVLEDVVRLQHDEVVLIHDGTSVHSQALINVARRLGGKVFTTYSTPDERSKLVKEFGLDASILVHDGGYLTPSYLLHRTGGKHIDALVTANPSATLTQDLQKWVADYARIAVLSHGEDKSLLPINSSGRNLSLSTIDLEHMLTAGSSPVHHLLPGLDQYLQPDFTPTIPVTTVPVAVTSKISKLIDSPENHGILALELSDDIEVPVTTQKADPLQLDRNGTYILAGGLGSLGLRISKLMAHHGAGHIVLLSRSGSKPKYEPDLEEIAALGTKIDVIRCDVTAEENVNNTVASLLRDGRKIRGFVQCAMVLQDSIFDNMTHEQWQKAYDPKVSGTWYLHKALPKDLDFFIMLSSVVSVIGNVAQANYAAGNSWMDALAHYRRTGLGLPAVSLNVGIVMDSDHTIDGAALADGGYLERFGHMAAVSTTLDELDIGLTASMRGHTISDGDPVPPQLVFGMNAALVPSRDQWARDAKFVHRVSPVSDDAAGLDGQAGSSLIEQLKGVSSAPKAAAIIMDSLKKHLAPSLGIQAADISDDEPLYTVGVDSFKAIEIRNHVFRELKSDISVFEILSPTPLAQLASVIVSRSQLVKIDGQESEELAT